MASIKRYVGKTGISWQVRVRKGGKLKTGSFPTKRQAEEFIALEESAAVQQKYFPQLYQSVAHNVGELIDLYTQRLLSQKAPKTQRTHGSCLKWWRENLGDTLLTHVTPALLEDYIQVLRNKGYSAPYVNSFINSLSPAFTLACSPRLNWLASNPFSYVKRLREAPGRAPMLTPVQIEQLIECCDNSKSKLLGLYCRLALACGGRKREILHLTWDNRH
jgi:integrase